MGAPSDEILDRLLENGCARLRATAGSPVMPLASEFVLEGRERRLIDLLAVTADGRLVFVEIKSAHGRAGFVQLVEYAALARTTLDPPAILEQWACAIRARGVPQHVALRRLGTKIDALRLFATAVTRLKTGDYTSVLAVKEVTPALADLAALHARNPFEPPILLLGVEDAAPETQVMRPSPMTTATLTERDARALRPDLVRAYAEKGWRRLEIASALHVTTRTIDRDIVRLRHRDGWRYRPERFSESVCRKCGGPAAGNCCRRCHSSARQQRVEARRTWLIEHQELSHREAAAAWGVSDETIRVDRRALRTTGRLPEVPVVTYRLFDDAIVELWNTGTRLDDIARRLGLRASIVQTRVDAMRRSQRIRRRNAVKHERFRAELADLLTDRSVHGAAEAAQRRGWTARRLGKRIRELRQILAA